MGAIFKETMALVIGAIFGALIGNTIDVLQSDISNWVSWVMFFVVLSILIFVIYIVLKIHHKSH